MLSAYLIYIMVRMRRNLILLLAIVVAVFLGINSVKRILSLHGTSQQVEEEEAHLEKLRKENEALKQELEYKKSERFAEGEIRNKLGMAKDGEEVVVIPKEEESSKQETESKKPVANWKKWQKLFFGNG